MILPAHSYRKGKGPDNGLSQTYHMTAPGGVATATTPRPKTDRRNQPCSVLFASTFWLRGVWHSAVARASPGLILCARLIFGSGAFRTFFCSSIVSTNLQPPPVAQLRRLPTTCQARDQRPVRHYTISNWTRSVKRFALISVLCRGRFIAIGVLFSSSFLFPC